MELAFAFLSRAAERSRDGTVHAFGAGFETVTLPQVGVAKIPIFLVAKFRCESEEMGQVHEIGVDLTDPHGTLTHLASEQIVVGRNGAPSGATLVAALDAPLKTAGEHTFVVSVDGTQVASLPITVNTEGQSSTAGDAMPIRAQWMRELGMSEEEIAPFCDSGAYSATTDEELANLSALRRMRSSDWSI